MKKRLKESSIVAQKIPKSLHDELLKTFSGGFYPSEVERIRIELKNLGLNWKQINTITAFCNNYYIRHKRLPTIHDLKKVFPLPDN